MPAGRKELDLVMGLVGQRCDSIAIACADHPHAPIEARYFRDGVLVARCFKCERILLDVALASCDEADAAEVSAALAESARATQQ